MHEKALIIRLHLLQGAFSYYQRDYPRAHRYFDLVSKDIKALEVDDAKLSQLLSMGYKAAEENGKNPWVGALIGGLVGGLTGGAGMPVLTARGSWDDTRVTRWLPRRSSDPLGAAGTVANGVSPYAASTCGGPTNATTRGFS